MNQSPTMYQYFGARVYFEQYHLKSNSHSISEQSLIYGFYNAFELKLWDLLQQAILTIFLWKNYIFQINSKIPDIIDYTYVALSDPGSIKFSHIIEQSPCNWETTMHRYVVLSILKKKKYINWCGKQSDLHYSPPLVSNRQEKVIKWRKTVG